MEILLKVLLSAIPLWKSCCVKLTFYADDFRPVPLPVGTTLSSGHMALQEAVGTLVAHY